MNPELRQYLTEWYEWATGDAVDRRPFSRGVGLCAAAGPLRRELEKILKRELGDKDYPFGECDFNRRMSARAQHLCPKRLAWVREKLGLPDAEAAAEQSEYRADQARDRAMIEQWGREQGDVL